MKITQVLVSDILNKIQKYEDEVGKVTSRGEHLRSVNSIQPAFEAEPEALSWINIGRPDQQKILDETKADVLVVGTEINFDNPSKKTLLICDNPKLVFSIIVSLLVAEENFAGIHPSAVIDPNAKIGDQVTIGANCFIGEVTILEKTFISDGCSLHDGVHIGRNVTIGPGTRIGWAGYGYADGKSGVKIQFPHIGGVQIEDDVEIGANSCIDRGSLGDTVIKKGAKIDNLVHIAHNVVIGENASVVALSMIGGSVHIGRQAYIAPSSTIRDAISVGDESFVGLGATVTKPVPPGETWAGVPAKKIR